MTSRCWRFGFFVFTCVACLSVDRAEAQMSESSIRKLATRAPVPVLADGGTPRDVGVAVAQIAADERGLVSHVTILQTPSPAVGEGVTAALRQWEFRQIWETARKLSTIAGRVTFYFVFEGGRVTAVNPADAGYVGRWKPTKRP